METPIKEIPEKLKFIWENIAILRNNDSNKEVEKGSNVRDAHNKNENSFEKSELCLEQLKEKYEQNKEKQRLNRVSKNFIQECQRKLNRANHESKGSIKRVTEMTWQLQMLTEADITPQEKNGKTNFRCYR